MDLTRVAIEQFLRFVLVACRVAGIFVVAPMLSSESVPQRVKVGLSVIVALVVWPVLPAGMWRVDVGAVGLGAFGLTALGELAIGLMIGLVVAIVLAGIEMAGLFVGQQTGLAFANVLDPLRGEQVDVTGQFYAFLALVVFLVIGGHRMLVAAILRSFQAVPLGGFRLTAAAPTALVTLAGQMFSVAVTISAPVVVTLIVTTVAMGLIARTVPQMNILVIGFPVRILLGWVILLASLGAVAIWSRELFVRMFEDVAEVISLM